MTRNAFEFFHSCCKLASLLLLFLLSCVEVNAQMLTCLRPSGCYLDECCFSIMIRTGPRCARIDGCSRSFSPECCRNTRAVSTNYGNIYGYAILLDDLYEYRDSGIRYLNVFLGIPYARPPLKEYNLRFQPPETPVYTEKWDATYYRPACPQPMRHLNNLIPSLRQTSEDCLYMNIFVPNTTIDFISRRYPIMVFLHGGHHIYGSAAAYPGHIMAQHNIMVITVQSRLNAFGFLSFESPELPGNYGLLDQVQALRYIRTEIDRFRGNASDVTLMGHGSGAGDVALHMMSKLSGMRTPTRLFRRAVWMSGSDLMEGGFIKHPGEAKRYARELAVRVGCSLTDESRILTCLSQRTAQELAEAAEDTKVREPGWIGRPWSPVVDGKFITGFPLELRKTKQFARIPVIGGVVTDDGSDYVLDEKGIKETFGVSKAQFDARTLKIANDAFAKDEIGVAESIQFEYTWWSDPNNDTWRLQMLRDIFSDWDYGAGVVRSLQYQADAGPFPASPNITQMYVFKYRSAQDPRTKYLGAYHGSEIEYMLGLPYLNDTQRQEIGLVPLGFKYEELDRNMSNYMMFMFSNYVLQGNATPVIVRNLTWDTFRPDNRTYILLNLVHDYDVLEDPPEYDFHLKQNYRTYKYAFWQHFFPELLSRPPRYSTPVPTPYYLEEYKTSSISLGGLSIVVFIIVVALAIVYFRRQATLK